MCNSGEVARKKLPIASATTAYRQTTLPLWFCCIIMQLAYFPEWLLNGADKTGNKTHKKRSRTLKRSSRKTVPNTWTHVRCLPSSTFKHKYCFSYCLWLTLIVIVVNSPAKDAFIVVFTSFFFTSLPFGWLPGIAALLQEASRSKIDVFSLAIWMSGLWSTRGNKDLCLVINEEIVSMCVYLCVWFFYFILFCNPVSAAKCGSNEWCQLKWIFKFRTLLSNSIGLAVLVTAHCSTTKNEKWKCKRTYFVFINWAFNYLNDKRPGTDISRRQKSRSLLG